MKHLRGLVSTAQALRQTFIAPLNIPKITPLQSLPVQTGLQMRYFQESRRLARLDARQATKTLVQDEAIRAPFVQLVNANGDLEPPTPLSDVLSSFDRSKYFLLQVSPGAPKQPPVCKILNKMEYRENEKAKAKAAKASKIQTKQIELNWAIDAHDLAHRLKQLTTFLEKGRKVEIVLTRKRHKRAPTVDEIKQVMQSVLNTTKDAGGTQVKAMEGEPGKHVTITVKKEN
ncbi:uncharacterized protein N7459_007126 [Penicillium hispanicum]|uniref:uncharacterized protein n=1 Tax=Penicillium hispanicum TaxID=1080232 RepID=UPI0025406639|nr:uncharacterized protein N7459_007126 [Penicillium hispanicum]KAJ5578162.1 hypothetical protein N7459_007126 [Penicillium hispanicum]